MLNNDKPVSGDNPAQKLVELPPEVRSFLSGLRPEEIAVLRYLILFSAAIMTVGKATRFVVVLFVGFIVGLVMLGESIQKIITYLSLWSTAR